MKIKSISIIFLAATAAFACKPETTLEPASPVKAGEQITITASSEGNPTKTVLQSDGKSIWWQADDSINLFYGPSVGGAKFDNTATEPSAVTTFTGTLNSVIGASEDAAAADKKFWGIYPYDASTELTADGTIKRYLPLGAQLTKEGTFAPMAFPSVACSDNLTLKFYNVCGALAIDVEEEDVISISLKGNNGEMLDGDAVITLTDGKPQVTSLDAGVDTITLYPDNTAGTFEKGKTYYMAVLPTSFTKGVTITLNKKAGEPVVLSTDKELKIERNKTNALTAKAPEAEKAPALERVWGWYSEGTNLWTKNVTAISITHPDGYGMARGLAMDDEYIYLPKSSGFAALAAVKITDGSVQVSGNVTGVNVGGTFKTSFVRVMKNTDASVNGGKDILILSNLTEANAANVVTYAYTSGITAAPVILAQYAWDSANNVADWRRYGDRFFLTGTWQDGKIYMPSYNANKSVILSVANGARTAVTQIAAGATNSPDGNKDLTVYPGSNNLFFTNASIANLVAPTGGKSNGWDEYTLSASSAKGIGTYGYNFFEFNGKNYIAYARISGNKAWIEVIEDNGDLISSLEAQAGLLKSPIHSADNLDAEHATGGFADCAVRIVDGTVYIAALTRDGGLVVDKLILK